MAGTKAEQNLIGALLLDSKFHWMTSDEVGRRDFADDRLGIIYEQIGVMLSAGEHIDMVTVSDKLPEWGVRGISFVELSTWADIGEVYPRAAGQYATAVRSDALRRAAQGAARFLMEQAQDGGAGPADSITTAKKMLDDAVDGTSSSRIKTKSLQEVMELPDRRDWVIPGLLERRDRLILTAGEGVGKSTLARQLCVMSAAGLHPFARGSEFRSGREFRTPQQISPVRVLVIDAENTEIQWKRAVKRIAEEAAKIGVTDPRKEIYISAGRRIDITKGNDLSDIHRLIDRHKPDLIYIGPLYKVTSGAIQTDDDAAPLIKALDSIRERGITLVMEAHAAKGDGHGARDLRPRGSAALMGWPEFGLGLEGQQQDQFVPIVHWRGARDTNHMWPAQLMRGMDWWPFELG